MTTTTTKIFDLPRDLQKEIISRVTLKSMRPVRLTFKSWNKLWKSRVFSKIQAAREREEESQKILMVMDSNVYLMNIVNINEDPSLNPLGKLTCITSNDLEQQVKKISQVFYSEGLLLSILKDNVMVFNPYNGETRWIKPSYPHKERRWYRYALGYSNKKNKMKYKILSYSRLEIYDFDSDLWRSIDVTPHWKLHQYAGVSLKGNTYWCATERDEDYPLDDSLDDHMICFDFTKERFGPLMPMPFSTKKGNYVSLSCVREEKLAVSIETSSYKIDVWITTKIEVDNVLWSKFLTLDMQIRISSACCFIDEEKKVVIGFNNSSEAEINIVGEDGYLERLDLRDHQPENQSSYLGQCLCFYVPSLGKIKRKEGKLAKEQSAGGGDKKRKRVSIRKP